MNQNLTMVGRLFHAFHNESKAIWEFTHLETKPDFYKAYFRVNCNCGAVKIRTRAFSRASDLSYKLFELCRKDGTLDKYRKEGTYHSFFGYTKEAALKEAKLYKGDNYHL